MNKTVSKMAGWATPWLGLFVLVGLLGAGCQTGGDGIPFTPVPGVEPVSTPDESVSVPDTNSAEAPVTSPESGDHGDRFHIGDQVRVTFSGTIDNIPPHEETIKADGTITLPLIGAVKADGQSPGELQKAITRGYVPDYYKRLTVTVSGSQRVYYVGGQVRQPGRQQYLGTTTVTKAIQSASDFNDFADRKKVLLTRADGKKFTVDCIKAARDPALDLPVFPGDKIEVPMRGIW